MSQTATPTRPGNFFRPAIIGLALATTAIIGILFYQSSSSSLLDAVRGKGGGAAPEAEGALPDDATVFDEQYPGVANLDPDLIDALRQAATDAEDDGVKFVVNSGWRSSEYQEKLLREAISKHGSETEAAKWVATVDTSQHVSGNAVDIGPSAATTWLSKHGAEYGLCQIYRNEPWHYELRPKAIDNGCPRMYANPTQDPRMQK